MPPKKNRAVMKRCPVCKAPVGFWVIVGELCSLCAGHKARQNGLRRLGNVTGHDHVED